MLVPTQARSCQRERLPAFRLQGRLSKILTGAVAPPGFFVGRSPHQHSFRKYTKRTKVGQGGDLALAFNSKRKGSPSQRIKSAPILSPPRFPSPPHRQRTETAGKRTDFWFHFYWPLSERPSSGPGAGRPPAGLREQPLTWAGAPQFTVRTAEGALTLEKESCPPQPVLIICLSGFPSAQGRDTGESSALVGGRGVSLADCRAWASPTSSSLCVALSSALSPVKQRNEWWGGVERGQKLSWVRGDTTDHICG